MRASAGGRRGARDSLRPPPAPRALAASAVLLLPALVACTAAPAPDDDPATSELEALEARIWGRIDPAEGDARLREVEEALAACMADAGFEYHPQVAVEQHVEPVPAVLTREHAEVFGYGETIPLSSGARPSFWAFQGRVLGEQENIDYRAGLSAEAEAAYWAAMNGDLAPEDVEGSGPEDRGCYGRAMGEIFADVMVPEAFRSAETALRQSGFAIEADPRVVAAVEGWAGCLADAGFPGLAERHDGHNLVVERANELSAPADMPFEEITEVFAVELAEVQRFEREVALADAACLESTGFRAAWGEVRSEVHARVMATHRDDLEAWATWAEEQRAGRS